jgi:hypothetical protein
MSLVSLRRVKRLASALVVGLAVAVPSGAYARAPSPTVVTGQATEITQTSARMNGTVNPNGGPVRYHFVFYEGGPIDRLSHDAGSGSAPVAVSSLLTGLIPGTTYAFRLVAVNADGDTFSGASVSFTTRKAPCIVPRLRGLSLFAVGSKLTAAHCRTGKVRYRNLGSGIQRFLNQLRSRVVSQSPQAGRRVAGDTKVNLVLAPPRGR